MCYNVFINKTATRKATKMSKRKLTQDEITQLMTTCEISSLNPLWERMVEAIEAVIPVNTGEFKRTKVRERILVDTFAYFQCMEIDYSEIKDYYGVESQALGDWLHKSLQKG